jgi:predicted HTH domain antitoxin
MRLNLPDDILLRGEANATDCRLILAVGLYADRRIDYADACKLAQVTPAILSRELIHRGITIQQYPAIAGRTRRSAG